MESGSDPWGAACFAVPRHRFIPDQVWVSPASGQDHWVDRWADPHRWWEAVYSDSVLVTQIDEGTLPLTAENAARSIDHTSSSSTPSLVFACLDLLDVRPGDRVLEIGTGTGWTAGLLAHRVGELHVTTVEIDSALAARATASLRDTGFRPDVLVGDGTQGAPHDAPYDRVHVTCGVRDIPYAWVEQTRPGGVLVLPWTGEFGVGRLVRLTVRPDGTATGTFADEAWYMPMRSQRKGAPMRPWAGDCDGVESTTRLDPRLIDRPADGAGIVLSVRISGVEWLRWAPDASGTTTYWLLETGAHRESWAAVDHRTGTDTFEVEQHGPRRLWDEVVAAYAAWDRWGRPGAERLGLTVTPDGQYLWIGTPERPLD